MKAEFFLPMKNIPRTTSQMKGINWETKTIFTKPELLAVTAIYKNALAPYRPEAPITGPVQVVTKWCFPTANKKRWGTWKSTKPDVGNSVKLFHDVMEDLGFFKNDSQIASEVNEKFWTDPEHSGIFVQLTVLEKSL